MELLLSGKHALVTGGTKGIGLEIAKQLLKEGCRVTVASRHEKNLNGVKGLGLAGVQIDLSSEESIRNSVGSVLKDSPVDILVVNSGGPPAGYLKEVSLAQWDEGYRILIRSVIILTELCVPAMRSKGWGRILNITSTSATEIIPTLPISGTFRAGLSAWTKHAAKEFAKEGIIINNLLPGPTRTDRLKELSERSPETVASMEARVARGKIAEPEEIAAVATFLVSSANTYLTGTDVLVDGGFTLAQ